jgi:outer membrane protein TolC
MVRILAILGLISALIPLRAGQYVTLEEAVTAAAMKAETADTGVALARAQLQLLEALSRRRVELHPRIGFLAFTQPWLLATSIGSGLLFSPRAAPSAFAIQSAELDLLDAEMSRQRSRVHREIQAAERFFEAAASQLIAERACAAVADAYRRQPLIEGLVRAAKLTMLDRSRYQQAILDRETECVEAETQRKLNAALLVADMGSAQSDLRVQSNDGPAFEFDEEIPPLERLVETAYQFRGESSSVEKTLPDLRRKTDRRGGSRSFAFSLDYSNLREGEARATPYLLGGHILHPEVSWKISLRDTGERAAENEILRVRLKKLAADREAIKEDIRRELTSLRIRAQAGLSKVSIARKKLAVSRKTRSGVAIRLQAGLAGPADLVAAEEGELHAQNLLTRAQFEARSNSFSILALCGIERRPAEQQQLLRAAQTEDLGDTK